MILTAHSLSFAYRKDHPVLRDLSLSVDAGQIAVLLGPTLPLAEARSHLDALYLPPAEQGSVFRAVLEHRPSAIAIVDGVFAQRPAVRHGQHNNDLNRYLYSPVVGYYYFPSYGPY